LHQNAFHEIDTYTSLNKQYKMLSLIMDFYYKGKKAIEAGADIKDLFNIPVRERIGRVKYVPEDEIDNVYIELEKKLDEQINASIKKEVEANA